MYDIKNKVVIITGAGGGIGSPLSFEFGKNGAVVVIAARSLEKLKRLETLLMVHNIKVFPVVLDLTSKDSIRSMIKKILKKYGRIDILVNNAAVGLFETVGDSRQNDIKKLFETNLFGPLLCIQLVLPHMRKRKNGLIVNMSSAVSKHSLYHQGIYSASKAALERVTEAVSIEEYKNGIKTLLVIPDRTKTAFRSNVLGSKKYAKLPFKLPESKPKKVAEKIINAIKRGNAVYYTSLRGKAYSIASGLYPEVISEIYKKSYGKFTKQK